MEKVCKELDDIRSEMESLKAEYKSKCQLAENLRRALDELHVKFHSAEVEIEKQAKVVGAKSEKIAVAQQRYEELEFKFQEKDSVLKQMSLASESSRVGFKEKIKKLEQANKELVFALDDANVKAEKEEKIICAYTREIDSLKRQMCLFQSKYSDAELRAPATVDVRRREEMLDQLVREKGEIEDQLKWKSEQFRHLEEALSKVQGELQASKKDWELEKTNLLNHITYLQSNLDSHIQGCNELRTQLEMCNHALVHEERRRRLLEAQISKSKEMYENIMLEYDEAQSNIEALTTRGDGEIALLRNSMSAKMVLIKELEHIKTVLEQENQELLKALKEAHNVECNGVDASSLKSLRQKCRSLELAYKECSKNLKDREVYWSQKIHKLNSEHDECLLKLNSKDQKISLLEEELEYSNCLAMHARIENNEMSMILALLKSKFTEISCDVKQYNLEVEQRNQKAEERITVITEQFENKNVALIQALAELSNERKNIDMLKARIEQSEHAKFEYFTLQKEFASCESVLTELAENIDCVTEEAAKMEIDLQKDLRKLSCGLEEATISLSDKTPSLEKIECELHEQRKVVSHLENVNCDLEIELKRYCQENNESRRCMEHAILEITEVEKLLTEEKVNFHSTLEEKERRVHELEQQSIMLEEELAKRDLENSTAHKIDLHQLVIKESHEFQIFAENLHRRLTFIQAAVDTLEMNHEAIMTGILMKLDEYRSRCLHFLENKLGVIADMQECILSYDQGHVMLVEGAANFKHANKLLGNAKLYEELDKIIGVHILDRQEMQYKNFLIAELEKSVADLQVKLESEEKLSSCLAGSIKDIEAQLETEKFELDIELEGKCSIQGSLENKMEKEVNRRAVLEIMEKFTLWKVVLTEQMKDFQALLCNVNNKEEKIRKHWDNNLSQRAVMLVEADIHIDEEDPKTTSCNCKAVTGRKYVPAATRDKTGETPDGRFPLKEQNFKF